MEEKKYHGFGKKKTKQNTPNNKVTMKRKNK